MAMILSENNASEIAEIFRIMGDPNRLRIAVLCLDSEICVSDIAKQVGLSPSLVSHHLRLMRALRFVSARRQGKQIFHTIRDERVRCVIRDMIQHVSEEANIDREDD